MKVWLLWYTNLERRLLRMVGDGLEEKGLEVVDYQMTKAAGPPSLMVEGDIAVVSNHTVAALLDVPVDVYLIHHGVGSSKNHTFLEKDPKIVCEFVSSNYAARECVRRGVDPRKLETAGFLQMDNLDHTGTIDRILVAPTWNAAFNGQLKWVEAMLPALVQHAAALKLKVVVQTHHYTATGFVCNVAHAAKSCGAEVIGSNGSDLLEQMSKSAILIGDMGSALFSFLPTRRPIMAYNSFEWWNDHHGTGLDHVAIDTSFDPDDLAFRWRDMFYQFGSAVEGEWMLPKVLDMVWGEEPDPLRPDRMVRCDQLFGTSLDGKVVERIVARIMGGVPLASRPKVKA